MKKKILVVLVCALAFGWTGLSVIAASDSPKNKCSVSEPNSKCKKGDSHKHKQGEKKCQDANSISKK